MTQDQMMRLNRVLSERLQIQYENPDDPHTNYTYDELLGFAIEEAWQNDELNFLTAK